MIKLIRFLIAIALLALAQSAAQAEDSTCKFAESSYSYIRVAQQGETWTYLLTTSGPNWRNLRSRRHATGYLACENCPSAQEGAGGTYLFEVQADLNAIPSFKRPTAAERAERRTEWVVRSGITLGPKHLAHHGSREGIALGPFSGYAVLYRLVAQAPATEFWADTLAAQGGRLLAIHLTDGCVTFQTTILNKSRGESDPWWVLDSLLAEVRIEKLLGAPAGPVPRGG
jgi:hypothetical protein